MPDRPPAELIHGDCLAVLPTLADASVDSLCTDPPSSTHFMGRSWDSDKGGRTEWVAWLSSVMAECLRCLKPGGYALVWALPRRSHWTALALEDAGFIIRDRIAHLFGSGFPKSKACLKPAVEDWWLARKPGPLAALGIDGCRVGADAGWSYPNGRGGKGWGGRESLSQNLDVPMKAAAGRYPPNLLLQHSPMCRCVGVKRVKGSGKDGPEYRTQRGTSNCYAQDEYTTTKMVRSGISHVAPDGREAVAAWECSDNCPVRLLDEQAGERKSGGCVAPVGSRDKDKETRGYDGGWSKVQPFPYRNDSGGPSRFYPTFAWTEADDLTPFRYCPKASRAERNAGLAGMPERPNRGTSTHANGQATTRMAGESERKRGLTTAELKTIANHHPTVKPLKLCEWLVRLITPPGGVVLDPFLGSGSIGVAAVSQGFRFIGIEAESDYLDIARARIDHAVKVAESAEPSLFST